jgi:hypothetical protein
VSVFQVSDRVTTGTGVGRAVAAVETSGGRELIEDWQVIERLEGVLKRDPSGTSSAHSVVDPGNWTAG